MSLNLHFARFRLDQIGPLFYRFSVDPKQKLADYSRRGIFSDGQLFPKHVTRVFPSELEPASHHTKKLKWESILAMNQDLGFCSKIFEKLLYYGFSSGQDQSESDRLNKGKLTWK